MTTAHTSHLLEEEARRLLPDVIELRRRIHREPEIGLNLPITQALIAEELSRMGLEPQLGDSLSSVTCSIEGRREGPTTLLRADMDALPLHESTGLSFASIHDGAMHACGHDAHVAMLLGAAQILVHHQADLAGRVILMFQPGEEGYSGARHMIDEGLYTRYGEIDRAFAVHITPQLPSGYIGTRAGTIMASADEFEIVVTGRGGHASMPHDAIDPIPAACEIVLALQSALTRQIPVFDPAVVTIAELHAGTAPNVIPPSVSLRGTMRAVSDSTNEKVKTILNEITTSIATGHHCQAEIRYDENGYPVTVNNEAAARRTLAVARTTLGTRVIELPTPIMGAEDWSFILQRTPGSMAFLGAAPPGVATPAPNHSNLMLLDEESFSSGVAIYAAMALEP